MSGQPQTPLTPKFGNRQTSYGQIWYGRGSFPGFFYKKNLAVGLKRSSLMVPGGSARYNKPTTLWNNYVSGSGVGASSIAVRRAKRRYATTYESKCC